MNKKNIQPEHTASLYQFDLDGMRRQTCAGRGDNKADTDSGEFF